MINTNILNLRNGMEDNLLLIQQIHLMIQKEVEEQKGFKECDRLCKVVELSMQCCGKLLSDSFKDL